MPDQLQHTWPPQPAGPAPPPPPWPRHVHVARLVAVLVLGWLITMAVGSVTDWVTLPHKPDALAGSNVTGKQAEGLAGRDSIFDTRSRRNRAFALERVDADAPPHLYDEVVAWGEARRAGRWRSTILVLALYVPLVGWLMTKIGYRWFDQFLACIPIYGCVAAARFYWRWASLPRRYWSERATAPVRGT